ncbi:MAG: deoxynucleoside kinase [Anaerolineales bacterium]|nr:deoxynucleoside kinase [Anaerolineales bacterium]
MKPLIVLVGASGVGKTALMNVLQEKYNFAAAREQHAERPFQILFKSDARYALANQLDYLLLRAEQERKLRFGKKTALMDGGFDLDFHGFTRLFHARGWLSADEFDLCRRFHAFVRQTLPPPDLIVYLYADEKIIRERLASRNRINIASEKDAALLNQYILEWLQSVPQKNILRLDVSNESADYPASAPLIFDTIQSAHGKL